MLQLNSNLKGNTTMSQLNPVLATLGKLQTRTAMMAQLTQAVQADTISINRKDLQLAFADIEQTISAVVTTWLSMTHHTSTLIKHVAILSRR